MYRPIFELRCNFLNVCLPKLNALIEKDDSRMEPGPENTLSVGELPIQTTTVFVSRPKPHEAGRYHGTKSPFVDLMQLMAVSASNFRANALFDVNNVRQ